MARPGYGLSSRSGASGTAASPTTNAVRCPTSVKVGLRAALPVNAANAATWHRDRQRPLDVSRQRARHPEDEVAHPTSRAFTNRVGARALLIECLR